jgi:hypothetical protein
MTAGRNARAGLPQVSRARPDRVGRDRLEILTALINCPSFDPIFRPDVIVIPRDHPVYRWTCVVDCCQRSRSGSSDLCAEHLRQLADARARGVGRAEFITAATGLDTPIRAKEIKCRVCSERPADQAELKLCRLHWHRWQKQRKILGEDADFAVWLADQEPLPGYGRCVVAVCVNLAKSPLASIFRAAWLCLVEAVLAGLWGCLSQAGMASRPVSLRWAGFPRAGGSFVSSGHGGRGVR